MSEEWRLEQQIETIARWIVECEHIVAFTGAGISTDSGIPDFRGPNGVWTRRDAGLPAPRWRVSPGRVEPNASHLSLVELQRLGQLPFLLPPNTHKPHPPAGGLPPRGAVGGPAALVRRGRSALLVGGNLRGPTAKKRVAAGRTPPPPMRPD